MGLASTVFDEVIVGEIETSQFGRRQGAPAFERPAKESPLVLYDNQDELKKLNSSLIVCDSRTSHLLFNAFIDREFETKDKTSKFQIMLAFDLRIINTPNE